MGKASTRAKDKYNAANYDSVLVRFPKGKKQEIEVIAKKKGISTNAFISEAIDEKIEKERV